jgi:hypothetical protein
MSQFLTAYIMAFSFYKIGMSESLISRDIFRIPVLPRRVGVG